MKTKKQIQKELEKMETFYLALVFDEDGEGVDSEEFKFLSEWITKNCQKWDWESCSERIVTLQWVLDCKIKLPKFGNYKLEEFVEKLKGEKR